MAYTEVGYTGEPYPGSGVSDAGLLTNAINAWPAYGGFINWHSYGAGLNALSGYYTSPAPEGLVVCMNGEANYESCGTIKKDDVELHYDNYGDPYVDNLILIKGVCSIPGDSGGSVTAAGEPVAVGIDVASEETKGTNCREYSWTTPINDPLSHWGLTLMG